MQYSFGSGVLYGRKIGTNPTPVRFGGLQGVSLDFSLNMKELYGQYQYPIALGRGSGKITGKADYAQFNAQAFNDLFFNESAVSTGSTRAEVAEAQTVAANTVTVTHNGAISDYGVVSASTGVPFQRVANAPAAGQYSCNESTGVYTFHSGANNSVVHVSYTWADGSNGKKVTLTNQLLGSSAYFTAVFTSVFESKRLTVVLNRCASSKLSLASKLEDFVVPSFDFQAFSDDANELGSISLEE